ncbi:MAG: type II secretion system F family protein [Paracoccaceae bacterium]
MERIVSPEQIDLAITLAAALTLALSILVLVWPRLFPDRTARRLQAMRAEQLRIRDRARRAAATAKPRLVVAPKPLWTRIVQMLGLHQGLEDGRVARKLRLAGYRGVGPVYAYLVARTLLPVLGLCGAALYLYVLTPDRLGPTIEIGALLVAGALGHYAPSVFLSNRIAKRQTAIVRAWPDALDLLLICIEAGMTIEVALRKVADEIVIQSIELAEEISLTVAELSYLQQREEAFKNFGERTGSDSVRAVCAGMIQSEKFGTSLGGAIRVLAQEQRNARMSAAEKKAAALPPKLTVPMILFFLPVLFVIILTPAGIELMGLN